MLYIFRVDTGTMMQFDMSLALESVDCLKNHIEKQCKLPASTQVLLVSGGQVLEKSARVCSFSAGTDTNPIFLFTKSINDTNTPPPSSVEYNMAEFDLTEKVREAQELSISFNTVLHRANLAQNFHELAKEQARVCENLVHDQHLQQQGWAAVIANLEDLTNDFKRRSERYRKTYEDFYEDYDSYLSFLQSFYNDLEILEKIPVLPVLLPEFDGETVDETNENADTATEPPKLSLLQWIKATDKKSTMDGLFEHCAKGLEQFNKNILNELKAEMERTAFNADNNDMKEVKGLGDRLYGLEQLMLEAKRYVSEQAELAQAFLQNQQRATNIGDASILPDLCTSHRKQLLVMLQNHQQLCDIRRRCSRAKDELSINLYHRLKWVMYIESVMLDTDHRLNNCHENIQIIRRQLEILRQIHVCPATYLSAVAEVVRRRAFSQAFLVWASELACHLLTIHNEEVTRRKEFQSNFEGHFLNSLFPGMEDLPPSFATQAPSIFDGNLPRLSMEDIEMLKQEVPELQEFLKVPELSAITNFFLNKSIVKSDIDKVDDRGVEEKLVQVVEQVGLASNLDQNFLKPNDSETCLAAHLLPHLKDLDRGCESETDTEEFEKVCQSPLELHFDKDIPSPRPGTQDASTLTEVGEKSAVPPRKPPRTFNKPHILTHSNDNTTTISFQSTRTLSISGSQSNTESFTNLKNPSLESIDELSSLKNFPSNSESCFNSHYQQMQSYTSNHLFRSKSLSPHTPQSPKDMQGEQNSPNSPIQGHQPEFVTDEFYIDESLPSSLSIEAGQSQGEFVKQLDTANNVVALLQDNLQTSRTEHDRLKSLLSNMALLSRQTIQQLKLELDHMKSFVITEKSNIELQYESLSNSWENLAVERDNKERAIIQRITYDYESEIQDFRRLAEQKTEEVKSLQLENICLEQGVKVAQEENTTLVSQITKLQNDIELANNKIEELSHHLQVFEKEKEKNIKEITDRLNREHRAEMENIRARYRFMTMERSPSESSLEKVERPDKDRESLVRQIKEACSKEKEEAIKDCLARESARWQQILEQKLSEMRDKYKFEKDALINEVTKQISENKDKQIELLQARHKSLMLENMKFKNTIHQMTESEATSSLTDLMEKVEMLEREKCQLEAELSSERSRRLEEIPHDMGASVAVYEGKVDAATSPIRHKERLTKSQTSLIKSGQLSIDTCSIGDSVLVIWNPTYENYTILQESSFLYFLHADCLEQLGLKKVENEERKMYCTGEVYDKEYCHAKKTENRYKVKKGTKFYRVKVRPLGSRESGRSSHSSSHVMSQSQTSGPTILENVSSEASACHSLPSTPTKLSSMSSKSLKSQKPDTETLVMQTSRLVNKSASLMKEIEETIPIQAIDTSMLTEQMSNTIKEQAEELSSIDEYQSLPSDSFKSVPPTAPDQQPADVQSEENPVAEEQEDSVATVVADSLNNAECDSNR